MLTFSKVQPEFLDTTLDITSQNKRKQMLLGDILISINWADSSRHHTLTWFFQTAFLHEVDFSRCRACVFIVTFLCCCFFAWFLHDSFFTRYFLMSFFFFFTLFLFSYDSHMIHFPQFIFHLSIYQKFIVQMIHSSLVHFSLVRLTICSFFTWFLF